MRLPTDKGRNSSVLIAAGAALFACPAATQAGGGSLPVGTNGADVAQRGTQPNFGGVVPSEPILGADQCFFCHAGYDPVVEPQTTWAASMMGQSARDPMFWACLTIANQDATGSGEFCIRCHIPNAFLGDRFAADGSQLLPQDFDSVNCNFCHRMVDPTFPVRAGSPPTDGDILADLDAAGNIPVQGANAQYVVDPIDARRGPFDLPMNPHFPAETYNSQFHRDAEFCWTCHDVSNPAFNAEPDGTYTLNTLQTPHTTADQNDMFPLHRTYSEWKNSYYFTAGGIQHNGRFGGNHPTGVMETCQDCHMPDQQGKGCGLPAYDPRPDVPQHAFIGSNTWGLKAVRAVDFDGDLQPDFPDGETGLTDQSVDAMIARNIDMLQNATDLQLTQLGSQLRTRVINQSGHKVPSGFPDGRRMWLNVKFFDSDDALAVELGEFDFGTGAITNKETTKVYEIKLGVDAQQASDTGLPEGETFHFVLANVIEKDNRIPPTGFSNNMAELNGHAPVGAVFADGQHWDDTLFDIPGCAARAVVTVYYQLVSDEYATFLRDTNITDNRGQVLFDLWDDPAVGNRSAPVEMDMIEIVFDRVPADLDGNGVVETPDMLSLLSQWGMCPAKGSCPADLDCDGMVGTTDFLILLNNWTL